LFQPAARSSFRIAWRTRALHALTMKDNDTYLNARDFARIARVLEYIDRHWAEQPSVMQLAAQARLSQFHFERLFRRWAGLSPKQYLQTVTGAAARQRLRQQQSALQAALEVGLSGPSRLHDLIVKLEAMSPAEYAAQGAGVRIEYGTAETPFGQMVCGQSARGVCHLAFSSQTTRAAATAELRAAWPAADLHWNPAAAEALAERLWPVARSSAGREITLHVRGTNFQLRVWRALLELAPAQGTSYGELARRIRHQGAARAVGGAVGANPVAWLIPCHRVLRAGGILGDYHWGPERKRTMLAWEQLQVARASAASPAPLSRPENIASY
jgi:AraC family transcriptional regulator, regulatory protein of adaptative response / methylated-DNA-[protein]-cysteine methyltransferase